jgi:hypothetical protein
MISDPGCFTEVPKSWEHSLPVAFVDDAMLAVEVPRHGFIRMLGLNPTHVLNAAGKLRLGR